MKMVQIPKIWMPMPVLLHITDAQNRRSIRRLGLRAGRRGLYALPVTDNFMATHQWARELKRRGWNRGLAVYFRMPSGTPVRAGHYNEAHEALSLGAAIARYLARGQQLGYEIILGTNVPRRNVLKTKLLHRPPGWRYFPEAKGKEPVITWFSRGDYGAAKLRNRLEPAAKTPSFDELKAILETTQDRGTISQALTALASKRRRASCAFLEPFLGLEDGEILLDLLMALERFEDRLARHFIAKLAESADPLVRQIAKDKLGEVRE